MKTKSKTFGRLKLLRFLLAGLPSFALAIPLNYFFVNSLAVNKSLAYAIVLFFQVTINFFVCIVFVFQRDTTKPLFRQYVQFSSGILFARFLDWGVYSILVEIMGFYFLLVQIFNVLVFSVLKYNFARRTVEGSEGKKSC